MSRLLLLTCLGAVLTAGGANAQGQFYEEQWKFSAEKGYYYCRYFYKTDVQQPAYKLQYVVYKPQADKHWVYWYNPDTKKFWGRCPTKKHPEHGKLVAAGKDVWCLLKDNKPDKISGAIMADWPAAKVMAPPVPGADPAKDPRTIPCPPDPPNLPD